MTVAHKQAAYRPEFGGLTVGTSVLTRGGMVSVEQLKPGTQMLTKDDGYAPLKSVVFHDVDLTKDDSLAPLKLSQNCFGQDLPTDDIFLAPGQLIALRHPVFKFMFGAKEVFARPNHMTDLPRVEPVVGLRGITYIQLCFECPQVVLTGSLALGAGIPASNSTRPVLSVDEARQVCAIYDQRRALEPFVGILRP